LNQSQESASAVEARPILEKQISALKDELKKVKEKRREEQRRMSESSDEGGAAVNRIEEELKLTKDLLKKTQDELKV